MLEPNLGKAGTPYAKSIPGTATLHGAKPAPEDLFDMLMARETFTPNPKGMSSMVLYFATIVIHDIFRTNPMDSNISGSSSYLDLAPLYGSSLYKQTGIGVVENDPEKGIDKEKKGGVRLMEKGLLKPDAFAEERLLGQPPGVCGKSTNFFADAIQMRVCLRTTTT